ncbi:MAG: hypothetical protein WKF59_20470 [Chitinophagaceae bacterium]
MSIKDGKLIANGKVTFNGSINGIEEYKNAFHGTEYGIETEWIPFAQGKISIFLLWENIR